MKRVLIKLLLMLLARPRSGRKPANARGPETLLFICSEGIGNAVMALPAIAALRRGHPERRCIVWTASRQIARLFRATTLADTVIEQDGGILAYFSSIRRLRRYQFDLGILCFPTFTVHYALVALLARCDSTISHQYAHPYFPALAPYFTRLVPFDQTIHDVQQNANLLRAIGLPLTEADLEHPAIVAAAPVVPGQRPAAGNPAAPFILIHPGSKRGHRYKQWPIERFIATAHQLAKKLGLAPTFLIGPDDEEFAPALVSQNLPVVRPADLAEAIALLAHATCLLCNDSGIMHLAALTGTPMVVVWGATDPARNGPWRAGAIHLRRGLACQPCVRYQAFAGCVLGGPPFPCLEIGPDEAVAAIEQQLSAATKTRRGK